MTKKLALVVISALIAFCIADEASGVEEQTKDQERVIGAFYAALKKGNLDEALAYVELKTPFESIREDMARKLKGQPDEARARELKREMDELTFERFKSEYRDQLKSLPAVNAGDHFSCTVTSIKQDEGRTTASVAWELKPPEGKTESGKQEIDLVNIDRGWKLDLVGDNAFHSGFPAKSEPQERKVIAIDIDLGKLVETKKKPGVAFPIKDPDTGNDLKMAYYCDNCKTLFPGVGMTAMCPLCGKPEVGSLNFDDAKRRKWPIRIPEWLER